jgi:DNA-binding NarL/FixJ family response regulator
MPRRDRPATGPPKGHAAILGRAGSGDRIHSALQGGWATTVVEDVSNLALQPDLDIVVLCARGGPAETLQAISECHPDLPVVVVFAELDEREVRGALAAGARGLLGDEDIATALEPCLHAVLAGQICVPSEQWRQVRAPALSMREKQVLGLLVMGYMNSQIAERLFLAESTVKSHLHSAFTKLGVRSRNEAVSMILNPQRGLGLGIIGVGAEPLALSSGTTA